MKRAPAAVVPAAGPVPALALAGVPAAGPALAPAVVPAAGPAVVHAVVPAVPAAGLEIEVVEVVDVDAEDACVLTDTGSHFHSPTMTPCATASSCVGCRKHVFL